MSAKAVQRNVMPSRGARFWQEDGRVMFIYVIDPGSVVGPQPARERDKLDHPEAWTAYEAEQNASRALASEPIIETTVEASEAKAGPAPMRRGPGRPRKRGAGNDASDDRPERV